MERSFVRKLDIGWDCENEEVDEKLYGFGDVNIVMGGENLCWCCLNLWCCWFWFCEVVGVVGVVGVVMFLFNDCMRCFRLFFCFWFLFFLLLLFCIMCLVRVGGGFLYFFLNLVRNCLSFRFVNFLFKWCNYCWNLKFDG